MDQAKGTILITGANGTLATSAVSQIVSKPEYAAYHGLYMVRDASRAPALRSALQAASHPHPHDIVSLDMSELNSVRKAAAAINARVATGEIPPIRAIILNAGFIEYTVQTWTTDGFDIGFATNYLGHWLLTLLLLQSMNKEASRVLTIGSLSHDTSSPQTIAGGNYTAKWKVILNSNSTDPVARGTWSSTKDDPSFYCGYRRYSASKLCQVMMIPELQRRLSLDPALKSISVLGIDPGTVPTDIARRSFWLVRFLTFSVVIPLMALVSSWFWSNPSVRTPKKSAADILTAAMDLGVRPSSLYMNGCEPGEMSPEARDTDKQLMVWKDTVRYVGLKEGETVLTHWR
ncbi:putative short-chain dehydrogenase [Thozetella sp. PMI_491]|nr:putative short-chain dehydrogenase [Thozetella sp. PMI_491]